MQFSISATFLALVGSAFAQTANFDAITSPTKGEELVADGTQSYKIVWEPTAEYDGQSVSIRLLQGASQDTLDFYPGANVASSIDSALGTYTWTPDSSIAGYATYGLKLQLDSDTTIFQYSFPFKITAGSTSGAGSVVSSSVSSTVAVPTQKTVSSSSSSSAAQTSVSSNSNNSNSNNNNAVSTVTTPVSASVTTSTAGSTGTGSATGSGSGAEATLTTTTKPSSTGSSSSSSSSSTTSAVVTAGADRVMAGGLAAFGVMAAMLAL
ncbi:hypothetical protein N0V93_001330 [Gnomoniopsis smithogilvyi]|uniref:Yeast cell wall synthesis Kre9/Knh1-like N-terminal domain-containing protein n=1 Tax=Gnomoniopsis smithogilvyi TaxID=1191159 RepID=A0A9W8Z1E7_9PEZI|nr:hypothetical protein N0V93_001330 [Gnomoniopsis smithogilvyi]